MTAILDILTILTCKSVVIKSDRKLTLAMDGQKDLFAYDGFDTISTHLVKAALHALRFGLETLCADGFGQL